MRSSRKTVAVVGVVVASLCWTRSYSAAGGRTEYRDAKGVLVTLPLGELSFADRVVRFDMGDPPARSEEFRNPELALGAPDYEDGDDATFTTLGCGGTLILEFVDNALVNGLGADLHVFEIGPDVEDQRVAVSADGSEWLELGDISGGTASVDIGEFTESQEVFRFIRLTDLKESCGSRWPGADIDAVAAVGGAIRLSLNSVVLFEFDKDTLKPEAASELRALAAQVEEFPGARVVIEGHTDSVGSPGYNKGLSERRAAAVRTFLQEKLAGAGLKLEVRGYGEARPLATNETDEGRQQNRRVDVLIIPSAN